MTDIEKLMKFFNPDPDDEEMRAKIVKMLQELFNVSKESGLATVFKEAGRLPELMTMFWDAAGGSMDACVAAFGDQIEDAATFCGTLEKLATAKKGRGQGQGVGGARQGIGGPDECICPSCGHRVPHEPDTPCTSVRCPMCGTQMRGVEETTEEQKEFARRLLADVRRERAISGAKHPLSGFAGGPQGNEGGPQRPTVVTREQRRSIVDLVLKEMARGETSIKITEHVTLWNGPLAYRVTLKEAHSAPKDFIRDPDGITWSAETHKTLDAQESLVRAIATVVRAIDYERLPPRGPAQHPLRGWQFLGPAQDIPAVITNAR